MALIALVLSLNVSRAETLQITNLACPVARAVKGKWQRLSPSESATFLRGHATIQGTLRPGSNVAILQANGAFWGVHSSCVNSTSATATEPLLPPVRRWDIGVDFFNWQEPLVLGSSAGNYNLNSVHLGVFATVAIHFRFRAPWGLSLQAGGFIGNSEAAEETGATVSSIQYRVQNAQVFGGALGPRLYLRWERTQVGIWSPFVARIANWPVGESGGTTYTPTPTTAFFPSVFLDSKIGLSPRVLLSISAGFLRSFKTVSWMTGLRYTL